MKKSISTYIIINFQEITSWIYIYIYNDLIREINHGLFVLFVPYKFS